MLIALSMLLTIQTTVRDRSGELLDCSCSEWIWIYASYGWLACDMEVRLSADDLAHHSSLICPAVVEQFV